MFRVLFFVLLLSLPVNGQAQYEPEPNWNADRTKNLFAAGRFDDVDEQNRPTGWNYLEAFYRGQAKWIEKRGCVRIRPADDGSEVAMTTVIDLPSDLEFLTFAVRMKGPKMERGKSERAGGGVLFSLIYVDGNTRSFPRLDPLYDGPYRGWSCKVATARPRPSETRLSIHVQVVDVVGDFDLDDIFLIPTGEPFKPSAGQLRSLTNAIMKDDGKAVAELMRAEPRLLEFRTGTEDNCTPLGRTGWYDSAKVAKVLIDLGADLESECFFHNNTPLGWACFFGNPKVAKVLVEAGCDSDGYDQRAQNAKRAKQWPFSPPANYDAIIEMLKSYQDRKRKRVNGKP